jgi:hypothetical protein
MSKVRPQYHFRKTATGLEAWYVERLIELSRSLPLRHIDPTGIAELSENHWYFHDNSAPTPLSIIEHIRLIDEADLSYPIILDSAGRVMDGMHRICKAVLVGQSTVPALQFEQDPEPDFVDCDPDELPYDA